MEIGMNEGFLKLPEERQQVIINAGFQIFALNSYKNAPVAEIAEAAGISKSLLFYHFKDKKELYLYLWDKSIKLMEEQLHEQKVLETDDYFEMLSRTTKGKCNMMRRYPYAIEFSMRAYYEQDSNVAKEIQSSFANKNTESERKILDKIDKSKFKEGVNFSYMYQEMIWATDGYMRNVMAMGKINPDKIEKEFNKLISMWKMVYLK
jgi:AcrR family transcriptional regulator